MTAVSLVLSSAIGILALRHLSRVIIADGFRQRPAPRSHVEDLDPRPSAGHRVR